MLPPRVDWKRGDRVSMKSGLEGRNNLLSKLKDRLGVSSQ